MNCLEFEELSGAYALGAITADERRAADAHLIQCVKCAYTLRELREVVSLLPLSTPEVAPSPLLKERLFARIRKRWHPR